MKPNAEKLAERAVMSANPRDFTDLAVIVPFEGKNAAKNPVPKWYLKAFITAKGSGRIDGVVVGLCIKRSKNRRFICGDADHPAVPLRTKGGVSFRRRLNIGEKGVIVPLQRLMFARLPAEIEDELQCADHCDGHASPLLKSIDRYHVANSCRSENDHKEVENAVPALQRTAPGRVVERVSQDIEAYVCAVRDHAHFFFTGGGGVEGACGCLGPTEFPGISGCLGPTERSVETDGWRGPRLKLALFPRLGRSFSLIRIVLDLFRRSWMKVPGGAGYTSRCRHPNTLFRLRTAWRAA